MQPGSWAVLISVEGWVNAKSVQRRQHRDQRGSSSDDNDNDVFLQYSFVRIRQTSADVAPEQGGPIHDGLVEVVDGLKEFLRETMPDLNISACESWVEEEEKDLRARVSIGTRKSCIFVMDETNSRALLNSFLKAD
jgi:hypothetical protein